MKTMAYILTILLLLFSPSLAVAQQDFNDIFDSAADDFKKLKDKADAEFSAMKASVDEEFGELLNNAWREFELARGLVRDESPKPVTAPVAKPADTPRAEPEKPAEKPKPAETPEKKPEALPTPAPLPTAPPSPPQEKTVPVPAPAPALSDDMLPIKFYGTELALKYDTKWRRTAPLQTVNPAAIKSSWDFFSKTDYASFLEQALYVKEKMALNDWGYCRLLNTVSFYLFPENNNRRQVFVWFMLVESGYDTRIGYSDNNIFVLIPSPQVVYEAPFYELGDRKYYITYLGSDYNTEVQSLFTYEGSHKEAIKPIDFSFAASPKIGLNEENRRLQFAYTGNEYSLDVAINETLIEFLGSYPQVDLDVYFMAPLSEETERSLFNGLKPIIAGKSETEAANIILRFVQTSLQYQTDDEQFNDENYLFPEESLHFPYCDCEDRSFLYGHLVKELLGLEVVGLQYPGHVATAVKFSSDVPGDSVSVGADRYVICDPTYINADIGQCMPQFKTVRPGIIRTGI